MGSCRSCVCKCGDPQDQGNRFRVINLDDEGKTVCPGIMELTDTCITFHIKRGETMEWPYRSLVKFGYEDNLFSFVSGRGCQAEEGIFGFRCIRAAELFILLNKCMENNRSVQPETSSESPVDESPVDAQQPPVLPRRYKVCPSLPASSSNLSSHRPEPTRAELITAPASTFSESSTFDCKEAKQKSNSRLESRVSVGGISEISMRSSLDGEDGRGTRLNQACKLKNKMENEEMEALGSTLSVELNSVSFDTGYDTDDRREISRAKRMGYENVPVFPRTYVRSRGRLVSVSSSDSYNPNFIPFRFPTPSFTSQPSSPCIFEEQSNLEQNISTRNGGNYPLRTFKQPSLGRNSINRSDCPSLYFDFDLRQSSQESRTLNYIQIEMESVCDSDNPETPLSADSSGQWNTSQQSEAYIELDIEKTTAVSLIHKNQPKDDCTRRTRHNSELPPDCPATVFIV